MHHVGPAIGPVVALFDQDPTFPRRQGRAGQGEGTHELVCGEAEVDVAALDGVCHRDLRLQVLVFTGEDFGGPLVPYDRRPASGFTCIDSSLEVDVPSEWSSVRIASRFSDGLRVGPFGTPQGFEGGVLGYQTKVPVKGGRVVLAHHESHRVGHAFRLTLLPNDQHSRKVAPSGVGWSKAIVSLTFQPKVRATR